jgi:hypothetical protein
MFMGTDCVMPKVENKKIKKYKRKEGVKVDVDEEGKIYYYTNDHDKNSPDLLRPCEEEEIPDIMIVDNHEDFHELEIYQHQYPPEYIKHYTNKKYIYELSFIYTDSRAKNLIDYLMQHLEKGQEAEVWLTWMDEIKEPKRMYKDLEKITTKDLKKVLGGSRMEPKALIVSKKV